MLWVRLRHAEQPACFSHTNGRAGTPSWAYRDRIVQEVRCKCVKLARLIRANVAMVTGHRGVYCRSRKIRHVAAVER